ncbi:MAG: hypothetical protein SFX73_11940 [Kofleriaceae bacterium]|nr:hypothetical protein [Kofleriaceae bacterium]
MRIPRSTIVMAVLTCIPFGLAIRDYVSGKDTRPTLSEDAVDVVDSDSVKDYEEYERERREQDAREEARLEERKKELKGALATLLGKQVANPGTAFGSIKPGITDSELAKDDQHTTELRKLTRDVGLSLELDDSTGILTTIMLSPRDSASDSDTICEVLTASVENWPGAEEIDDVQVWIDPTTGMRAEYTHGYDTCALVFRRYVPADKWFAKKDGLVPVAMIGQPVAKLVRSLEPQRVDLSNAEYEIAWTAPGLGNGYNATSFLAYIAKGKVAAVSARTYVPYETHEQVQAQLVKAYGEPKEDDEGALVWKKPALQLTYGDSTTHLLVGTVPEE